MVTRAGPAAAGARYRSLEIVSRRQDGTGSHSQALTGDSCEHHVQQRSSGVEHVPPTDHVCSCACSALGRW